MYERISDLLNFSRKMAHILQPLLYETIQIGPREGKIYDYNFEDTLDVTSAYIYIKERSKVGLMELLSFRNTVNSPI